MKEYTLDDAQAVANDLCDISLFLNSESCQNNEELRAVVWEGILTWLEMAPTVKAHWEEADKLKNVTTIN